MANIVKKHPRNCVKRKIHKILSTVKIPCFFVNPEKSPPHRVKSRKARNGTHAR